MHKPLLYLQAQWMSWMSFYSIQCVRFCKKDSAIGPQDQDWKQLLYNISKCNFQCYSLLIRRDNFETLVEYITKECKHRGTLLDLNIPASSTYQHLCKQWQEFGARSLSSQTVFWKPVIIYSYYLIISSSANSVPVGKTYSPKQCKSPSI